MTNQTEIRAGGVAVSEVPTQRTEAAQGSHLGSGKAAVKAERAWDP